MTRLLLYASLAGTTLIIAVSDTRGIVVALAIFVLWFTVLGLDQRVEDAEIRARRLEAIEQRRAATRADLGQSESLSPSLRSDPPSEGPPTGREPL